MDFNTAKKAFIFLKKSNLLDKDFGLFSILSSDFVINCESMSDWFNRVYLYFLIGQVRNFFINNPKLLLIFFKEEYPHICTGEVLNITNGLINTPNLTSDNLTTLINVL
tara:strand:+ start:71 stop:397 length:327 start_codon:yes stop_codon:yes gene_type:complete